MKLTGNQIKTLYEFLGGEFDTVVELVQTDFPVIYPTTGSLDPVQPGTYAWIDGYPEEGSIRLEERPNVLSDKHGDK